MLSQSMKCSYERIPLQKWLITPSIFCSKTLISHFASNSKSKQRQMQFDTRRNQKIEDLSSLPEFQHLLRQLYKKSHPDLLRASNPDFAEINDTSMQLLNGLLSTIKVYNENPTAMVKAIPFYVRNGQTIDKIDLKIRTCGGDSRRSLTNSFEDFFFNAQIIDSKVEKGKVPFIWGKDYFPVKLSENQIN